MVTNSLEKSIRPQKPDPLKTSNGRTLDSFFNAATQDVDGSHVKKALAAKADEEPLEDIEDDFDGAAGTKTRRVVQPARVVNPTRKRSWTDTDDHQKPQDARAASRKFLKVGAGQRGATPQHQTRESADQITQPWTERYAPKSLEELAVHHKKVADVRNWLQRALSGQQYQKLLILRGTAGTGKTATVSLLSKSMEYSVLEWKNPELAEFASDDYVSASSRLADFLSRAGKFGGLELVKHNESPQVLNTNVEARPQKRIMLMEEFPTMSGSSPTVLASFRDQILQYLAMSISPKASRDYEAQRTTSPLVLIISESVLSDNSSDSFTAHRLLGGEILHHPSATVIEFNAVAPTILAKALKLLIQKQTSATSRAQNISGKVIELLSHVGDIRNAASTLDYLCNNPDTAGSVSLTSRTKFTKSRSKTTKSKTPSSKDEEQYSEDPALSVIALRQSTLGLFHAVGKVVYNKRTNPSTSSTTPPSSTMSDASHGRPPPDLDVDALFSTTGTDTSTFLSALHENYVISCFDQYGDNEATLDAINGCMNSLGDADILGSSAGRPEGRQRTYYAAANEGMRQAELSFHVGVLGLQNALPYPVKRQAASQTDERPNNAHKAGRSDAHCMFYPTDLKLWRQREEIQGSLDFLVERALDGQLATGVLTTTQGGSQSRDPRDTQQHTTSQPGRVPFTAARKLPNPQAEEVQHPSDDSTAYTVVASGRSARKTMLLERLPFLRLIMEEASTKYAIYKPSWMREVQQVTCFTGVGVQRDEESDDENEAFPRSTTALTGRGHAVHRALAGRNGSDEMEKLVLSDDDIVDD